MQFKIERLIVLGLFDLLSTIRSSSNLVYSFFLFLYLNFVMFVLFVFFSEAH
jgi:hypothetical protein